MDPGEDGTRSEDGSEDAGEDGVEVREVELSAEMEYRFEVDQSTVRVTLLTGTAEMFGTELVPEREYAFGRLVKGAIYTWKGCRLRVKGETLAEYTSEETPMHSYLNTHLYLTQQRIQQGGPRVCLVGPSDSGKTSLAKILLAYSIRLSAHPGSNLSPHYISLDPGSGAYAIPTSMGISKGSGLANVQDLQGFTMTHVTGPSTYHTASTLVWSFASAAVTDNVGRWRELVAEMAKVWQKRREIDPAAKEAGCIIDMPGLVDKAGQELIKFVVKLFDVNVILVLGHERLHSDLTRAFGRMKKSTPPVLINLATSGGVVPREPAYRKTLLATLIKQYFHGTETSPLHPFVTTVKFEELTVYRFEPIPLTAAASATSSLDQDLLDGDEEGYKSEGGRLIKVDNGDILYQSIIALVPHDKTLPEIASSVVSGFIYISDVDTVKKRMTVLTPSPGRVPTKTGIMTALKWQDV